ncbi:ABC transporter permease subunit [Pseudothauera rhizosphaerae]|uniref:ABC transporter permease subunit n=1 Tax=Pseudothauera rhizosphaerae TaxID=2565932 RepID=A0A4S4ASC4_9RHOO|nr:ABC transporter permease subunit [Pseudothauera rhizosphaerae]THF62725.1 ABC transporter permease subunit [Pseudothauera rhizosphaerae]
MRLALRYGRGGAAAGKTPPAGPPARLLNQLLLRGSSPLAILLIWELASRTGVLPAHILAAPSQIGSAFWNLLASGELLGHLLVSAGRSLAGVSIGVAGGITLALISGLSRAGEIAVDAPMQMLRTLPSLALVPLFILWLGVGEAMKISMIAFGTAFPIYLTLFSGIRGVEAKLVEAAKTLGLTRLELIRHVILPGALPTFFVGLRFSLGGSWLALVVVEQVNAVQGIGFLANDARDFARTDVIVVCLLIYSLLGLTVDVLVRALERWALAWRPSFLNNP